MHVYTRIHACLKLLVLQLILALRRRCLFCNPLISLPAIQLIDGGLRERHTIMVGYITEENGLTRARSIYMHTWQNVIHRQWAISLTTSVYFTDLCETLLQEFNQTSEGSIRHCVYRTRSWKQDLPRPCIYRQFVYSTSAWYAVVHQVTGVCRLVQLYDTKHYC